MILMQPWLNMPSATAATANGEFWGGWLLFGLIKRAGILLHPFLRVEQVEGGASSINGRHIL